MERLDVAIVGAGLSGIAAGHYVQTECPWADYAIFEARDAIGGTWDLFRYPGVHSDSDMFTLGYAFRPWNRPESIADGPAILEYIKDTAAEEGIDDKIRFHHRIVSADWSSEDARWHITAERTDTGDTVRFTCGFLFSCSGYYRYDHGYLPDFAGMERFEGTLVHPQEWPDDLDYAGKRVIVIGSGATAVTLIPSMAADAAHVTMLQRSPSYIAATPLKNPLVGLMRRCLPGALSSTAVRWFNAVMTQAVFQISQAQPDFVKSMLLRGVRAQLPEGYDVETHFTPEYGPWDQRLCLAPNGDLFRSIRRGDASVVTDHIDTFTEHGILLGSGDGLEADIIVAATGLELLFLGGIDMTIDGEPVDAAEKLTYKGMMLEDVPNFALAIGYTNASWTPKCELTCQYVVRLLEHMHDGDHQICRPVNKDASVVAEPLLGLSSGYIQRAQDRFPRQGSKFPWQVHQSYLRDYRVMKLKPVGDDAMEFFSPRRSADASLAAG